MRSRNDSTARSACGRTISSSSHNSAGASSNASPSRESSRALVAALSMRLARSARRKADGALRIEAEGDALPGLEVGKSSRLRQGRAQLETAHPLAQQRDRVGAVEQHVGHLTLVHALTRRELCGRAAERHGLGPDEGLDRRPGGEAARRPRAHPPAARDRELDRRALDAEHGSREAIVGADETGYEGAGGRVIKLLWRAELLEAAVIHDADMIGQH